MKKTPLYEKHIALNARMVDFAGYQMPVQYSGIVQEHLAVRKSCGMFDVSHMGEFIVSGESAETFLNSVTINDVAVMESGDAQYSAMCYEHGGIIDDVLIYKYIDKYMLVVNASNVEKDFEWLHHHRPESIELTDVTDETGLIAIQGPQSREILQEFVNVDLTSLRFYTFSEGLVGRNKATIARTGYTGELGFELYTDRESTRNIWDIIMNTCTVTPCGLGCRDTLRMEMKYCLYGNDIDETTNPIEAELGWIAKLYKENFLGKDAIVNAKDSVNRRLVSFEMRDRAVPRKGYTLFADGNEIGQVTSGTQSPSLQKGIGLGFVKPEYCKIGTGIEVDIRGKMKKAIIVKPPFYKYGTARS